MLITALILLVLSMNVINGLSCIGENSIELSLIELTHDEFREEMSRLVSGGYDDDSDDIISCGIIITVDYTAKQLTVETDPGSSSDINSNTSGSAALYTTFTRTPHRNRISELVITCSSEDMCDEKFLTVNDHYQWWWLIDEVNHTEIEQIFKELFIKDERAPSTVRCYSNSIITNCSSKPCRAGEFPGIGPYENCFGTSSDRNYLIIRTVVLTNLQTRQLEHKIVYTCQFDICNEQSIFLKARNITYTYYNVTPMLRIFNEKLITESTSTSVTYDPIQSTSHRNSLHSFFRYVLCFSWKLFVRL